MVHINKNGIVLPAVNTFILRGNLMNKIMFLCLFLLSFQTPVQAEKLPPILLYHSIAEYSGHGLKGLYVPPEKFEQQIQYLKDHDYTLLTFEQWDVKDKVKNPIFITFDDGYKNNKEVYSIFKKLEDRKFHPKATLFIISDFIGRSNRLSESDLKFLSQSGFFSIQSHTATHPDLRKTKNLSYELKKSKEKIESITGEKVIALSYPFGTFNHQVIIETKKYYIFGLTTANNSNLKNESENANYVLPRTYVYYSTSLKDFAKILEQ